MTDNVLRNVNLQTSTYEIIQKECERRRNGERGFSLTLNQIIQEWSDICKSRISDHTQTNPTSNLPIIAN